MNILLLVLLQTSTPIQKPSVGTPIKYTAQRVVQYIIVDQGGYDVALGSQVTFSARAFDGTWSIIPDAQFTWASTNLSPVSGGAFVADGIVGPYSVSASSGNVSGGCTGNVVPAQSPVSPLSDSLLSQLPFNEGSGTKIHDYGQDADAVAGTNPFTWGMDSTYGAFITTTSTTSAIAMPVNDPVGVFSSIPFDYCEMVWFRPKDALFHGLTRLLDTNSTARFTIYPNMKMPGGSYSDPLHGYITVTYRDASNAVKFVTVPYNAVNPLPVLRILKQVNSLGKVEVWANLHGGSEVQGMELQASAVDASLNNTWQSVAAPTQFFIAGTAGGNATPSVDIFGIWLWAKFQDAATITGPMYSTPFGPYQ